jgi:hypothetical protein
MILLLTIIACIWLPSISSVHSLFQEYKNNFVEFWYSQHSFMGYTFNDNYYHFENRDKRKSISIKEILATPQDRIHTLCHKREFEEFLWTKAKWEKLSAWIAGYFLALTLVTVISLFTVYHFCQEKKPVNTEVRTTVNRRAK